MVVVQFRVIVDPFSCLSDQLTSCSEYNCLRRALFSASRHKTLLYPFKTHITFLNLGIGAVIFEFRDIERTGDHAVAASHTFFRPPRDRALFVFEHCLGQACCRAGGVIAVHALPLKVNLSLAGLVCIDYSPPGLISLALDAGHRHVFEIRGGKTMGLGAGKLAPLASGTSG